MSRSRARRPEAPVHGPLERLVAPGRALLAPSVANVFQDLGISAAVWTKQAGVPEEWYPMHVAANVSLFEREFGVDGARYAYNFRCFDRVLKRRAPLLGTHAGFFDLFYPVGDTPALRRVLTAGPFATARPNAAEIRSRYYALSKSRGRLSDPAFARYVSATISTLMLDGPLLDAFRRLLASFAGLLGEQGDPERLASEAEAMRRELIGARLADRMWEMTRNFLDERTTRTFAAHAQEGLNYFGVRRGVEHVIVGLCVSSGTDVDPLDELLRCHAFQLACVPLARKLSDVVPGQAGDQGVVFLLGASAPAARARARAEEVVRRAASLARRFGLRLHAGVCLGASSSTLPSRHRAAMLAAERAFSRQLGIVFHDPRENIPEESLKQLRRKLARNIEASPELIVARFEQYGEAAMARTGHHLEALRVELDAGLERLTEPLIESAALDEKGYSDLCRAAEIAANETHTAPALLFVYQKLIADLKNAIGRPTEARQDRGLSRAVLFIRESPSQPLTLAQVARVAGFAPSYFSRLFKRSEGMTFQRYVLKLRVDHAAHMLATTELTVERIRRLSGFNARGYFNRAFKAVTGLSPAEYRARRARAATKAK